MGPKTHTQVAFDSTAKRPGGAASPSKAWLFPGILLQQTEGRMINLMFQ